MQGKLGQPMGNFTHNAQHMAYNQKKTNNIYPVVDQLQNFRGCFCTPHIFVHIFLEFGKQVGEATVPEIQRTLPSLRISWDTPWSCASPSGSLKIRTGAGVKTAALGQARRAVATQGTIAGAFV